jgi:hypothetical protein
MGLFTLTRPTQPTTRTLHAKVAITILEHALEYLEPLGAGRDMEYNRARCILQYALDEVKRGVFGGAR